MVFDLLFIAFQMPHVFLILYYKKNQDTICLYTNIDIHILTCSVSISLIQRLQDYIYI